MTRQVHLLGLSSLAVIAAGCLSVAPTPSPASESPAAPASESPPAAPSERASPPASLPYGCWTVREPDCVEVLAVAEQAAGERGPFVYGEVSLVCLATPCPDEILPGVEVAVTLERDDRPPLEVKLQHDGERFAAEVAEAASTFLVEPSSGPAAAGVPFPYEIGHCGLHSGIDADRSWWDAVGFIDSQNPDTINSAKATMLIDGRTAVLQTAGGLRLDLVRHPGAKAFRGCM